MKEVIDGTLVPFTELGVVTDWSSIKKVCVIFPPVRSLFTHLLLKYHKLNGEAAIKGSKEHEIIDNIVVSSVAMKSVMA
jgi:EKC/KEOPS complex subunit CGI121/TPRKB